MVKMEITVDTPISLALEAHPQLLPLFRQIGMCCITDENADDTLAQLCARLGVDAGAFAEALNQAVRRQ